MILDCKIGAREYVEIRTDEISYVNVAEEQ
jgi:hypothetical protein